MTGDGGVPSGCAVVDGDLVAAYGAGTLGDVAAWSVEQHLPGCAACRSVLAGELDRARLERNLAVVLTRIGLPEPGPVERMAARLGVPPAACAAIEDSSNGLRSAAAAGLAVIAVPRPEYPPAAEALDHARLVLDSLTELSTGTIDAL